MKKHWIINQHSDLCLERKKASERDGSFDYYYDQCNHIYEHILFYYFGDFYLLSIRNCNLLADKYGVILEIFKRSKIFAKNLNSIRKSYKINTQSERERLYELVFENKVTSIHYLYGGNSALYSIVSEAPYAELLEYHKSNYEKNYQEAIKYLEENDLTKLTNDLDLLYHCNTVRDPHQKQIVNTIDEIILEINGYDKKNKLKRAAKTRLQHNDAIKSQSHFS